jgi:predicted O-methyltransferase YrrM
MYSTFQLAKKYLNYFIKASNGRGHGVHSPFVYNFITRVLRDHTKHDFYKTIELERHQLLNDHQTINVADYGAGSRVAGGKMRVISDIARSSLKSKKYARLLSRVVSYYKPRIIVELGTSFGITTAYLAKGNSLSTVYTLEGSPAIAAIAKNNFQKLHLENIQLVEGDFENTLPGLLVQIGPPDFVFIDGNHQRDATLRYHKLFSEKIIPSSILIFDDIHWSEEMEEAWRLIKEDPAVTLTIDLFFMGLVFYTQDIKAKQHFSIRY